MTTANFDGIDHVKIYAEIRPSVPDRVIEKVINFLGEKIDSTVFDLAVDVGCGSGQATNKLSKYFKHVYGFDVSQAQIDLANQSTHENNVSFEVSPAENITQIKSNSVQLLTACMAAQWFDFEKFFKECDRVLVDNGVLALIGYWTYEPTQPEDKQVNDSIMDVSYHPAMMPYRNTKLDLLENHHRDIEFPDNYEYIHFDNIDEVFKVPASYAAGFVKSWSHYQVIANQNKELGDKIINDFNTKLMDILKTDDLSKREINYGYTYFIAMGRKIN